MDALTLSLAVTTTPESLASLSTLERRLAALPASLKASGSSASSELSAAMTTGFVGLSDAIEKLAAKLPKSMGAAGRAAGKSLVDDFGNTVSVGIDKEARKARDQLSRMSTAISAESLAARKKENDQLAAMRAAMSAKDLRSRTDEAKAEQHAITLNHKVAAAERVQIEKEYAALAAAANEYRVAEAKADQHAITLNHKVAAAERVQIEKEYAALAAAANEYRVAEAKADQHAITLNHKVAVAERLAADKAAAGASASFLAEARSAWKAYANSAGIAPTLNSTAVAFGNLGTAAKDSAGNIDHWNKMGKEAHSLARGLAGSLNTLWVTWGSTVPILAGAALGASLKQSIKLGSELEYQLTFVRALSGATSEEVSQMQNLVTTRAQDGLYKPAELAGGLRILAQAGLSASEAMIALSTTTHVATVGEMSMQDAALNLVGVMNAFGLKIQDVSRVGDVFAKAAAVSQTSVEGMTNAMKYASVAGEMYGASMEDTATALTTLAKINIVGTAAGTSFRNMLKEIYAPSEGVAKVWAQMGISAKDAMGNVRPFTDVVYDLRQKLGDFDKSSQINILQKLFGERGSKEAIAMLAMTRKEWEDLKASIADSDGFAAKVSAALESTTKGTFQQVLNTLHVSLIKAFEDSSGAAANLASELKKLFGSPEFIEGLKNIVSFMSQLSAALVRNFDLIVAGAAGYGAFKIAMMLIGPASISAAAGIMGVSAATAGLVAIPIVAVLSAIAAGFVLMWERSAGAQASTASATAQNHINAVSEALAKEAQQAREALDAYNKYLDGKTGGNVIDRKQGVDAIRSELTQVQAQLDLARTERGDVGFFQKAANYHRINELADKEVKLKEQLGKAQRDVADAIGYQITLEEKRRKENAREVADAYLKGDGGMKTGPKSWSGADTKDNISNLKMLTDELKTFSAEYGAAIAEINQAAAQQDLGPLETYYKKLTAAEDAHQASLLALGEAYGKAKNAKEADLILEREAQNQAAYAKARADLATELEKGIKDHEEFARKTANGYTKGLLTELERAHTTELIPLYQRMNKAQSDLLVPNLTDADRARLNSVIDSIAASITAGLKKADVKDTINELTTALTELEAKFAEIKEATPDGILGGIDEDKQKAKALYDEIVRLKALIDQLKNSDTLIGEQAAASASKRVTALIKDSKSQSTKMMKDIEDGLVRALEAGFDNGKFSAKKFVDSVKQQLRSAAFKIVVQALIQPLMGSLASSLFGGSSSGGAGDVMNGVSGANTLYNASQGGGLYGSFATSSYGQAFGLSTPTTAVTSFDMAGFEYMTNEMGLLASDASFFASTTAQTGASVMTTFGTVLPYIAAALAVTSMFSKESTPHEGGIAFSSGDGYTTPRGVDAISGNYADPARATSLGMMRSDWTKRWSQETADGLGGASAGLAKTFNNILTANGKNAGYSVGMAFSADGEDPARGHATLTDKSGNIVASYRDNNDLGKDPGRAMEKFVGTEMPQMLLSALEEMDLNPLADSLLDSLDIEGLSADMANKALAWVDASDEVIAAFEKVGFSADDVTYDLIKAMGGFDAAGAAITAMAQKIDAIKAAATSTSEMFAESIRTIKLDTLDDPGKYDYLDSEAARYRDILATLTDSEAISRYSEKLNGTIMQAWNLVPEDQRATKGQEYIDLLQSADDLALSRYTAAEDAVKQQAQEIAAAVKTAVSEAMAPNVEASNTVSTTIARGIDAHITVDLGGANGELGLIGG